MKDGEKNLVADKEELLRVLRIARGGLVWAEDHLHEKLGMKSLGVSDALMVVQDALAAFAPAVKSEAD